MFLIKLAIFLIVFIYPIEIFIKFKKRNNKEIYENKKDIDKEIHQFLKFYEDLSWFEISKVYNCKMYTESNRTELLWLVDGSYLYKNKKSLISLDFPIFYILSKIYKMKKVNLLRGLYHYRSYRYITEKIEGHIKC